MLIREFGTEHKRHLLFFQGSYEPWIHFTPSAEALAKHFHVMLLTPDGHDPKEHNDFISVERTVDQAVGWLHANGIDNLDAVYGLSFGGGMVIRLLAAQTIPVDKAIIDAGTVPYQYPKWFCKLIGVRDYLMLKIGRSSVKFMEMAFPPDRFTLPGHDAKKEYREIQQYLKGYSNKTIWNIFWSANNYAVPKAAPPMDTKIQFWVGTDEWGSRFRDLKWAIKYLPQSGEFTPDKVSILLSLFCYFVIVAFAEEFVIRDACTYFLRDASWPLRYLLPNLFFALPYLFNYAGWGEISVRWKR